MTLTPGTRLGVFEIVSTLGVGGMGEVYLATDTRLKRQVAIKILPESLAADADRMARFEREAELLASLNHPNIAVVYGIEDTSAGKALVMELVEGADLRAELARRTPTVPEALTIARQLTKAIAAAHQRGIVHRDLKPGNIRLRPDGTVKVLDFGLAKAVSASPDDENTVTATRAGTIMGTPRYMSPEQARGEVSGTQSDIWAFGVTLYEMLAGRAAFDAGSSAETLSRVLNGEPDFSRLPASLHPRIKLLLQRCLRKDPSQRLHHIGDASIEIEEAAAAPVEVSAPVRANRWPFAVAAVAMVALAAVGGWAWLDRGNRAGARVVRSEIVAPAQTLRGNVGLRRVAISPDGQRIAIAAVGALYIRRLDESEFITIPASPVSPFFSPDGRWVAYFNSGEMGSGLTIVPATGGASRMVAATAERPAGGDWRSDGTIVFATTSGLYLVRDDGTQLRTLAKPDTAARERILAFPQFAPSNTVLFTSTSTDGKAGSHLAQIDLDTLKIDVVLNAGSSARYLPGGRLVYAARNRLMAVAFDPRRPAITPDSAVDSGVEITVEPNNGAADFDISDAGDLVYLPDSSRLQTSSRLAWFDRQGRREEIDSAPQRIAYPRVSPDGTRIVVDSTNAGNRDIWIYDLRQDRFSQLTFGPTEDNQPVWSRDGRRVFFASDRTGDFDIYSRAADGSGEDRLEFAGPRIQFPNAMTPDGTGLFVTEDYIDTGLVRFPDPRRVERILTGKSSSRLAELSPDGKWLAYESDEAGSLQVYVRPFPDVNSRREQVSPSGGRFPLWNPSDKGELFFLTADGEMMAAALTADMTVSALTKLFSAVRPPPGISGRTYDISPIDGRFVIQETEIVGNTTETRIKLITNWTATLKNSQ